MMVANRKRPQAAHHQLRRILHVSWQDKIKNRSIRERTGQEYMDKDRTANQTLHWVPEGREEEEDRRRTGQRPLRTT